MLKGTADKYTITALYKGMLIGMCADLNNSNVTIYYEIKIGILDNTCFKENVLTFEILVGWLFRLGPNFWVINVALYRAKKKISKLVTDWKT